MAKRTRRDADARGIGYWAGYAEGVFVGWWCLGVDDDDPDAAELGYRLRRNAWRQGLAVEGARALLEYGLRTIGLGRVWGETMAVNHASRAVMEKLAMRPVRTYVGEWDAPIPGWELGEVVYEIRRSAYS